MKEIYIKECNIVGYKIFTPLNIITEIIEASILITDLIAASCHAKESGGLPKLKERINAVIQKSLFKNISSSDSGGCLFVTCPSKLSEFRLEENLFINSWAKNMDLSYIIKILNF